MYIHWDAQLAISLTEKIESEIRSARDKHLAKNEECQKGQ